MIRYKLTNQKTGARFQFEAEEFPKEMQPEWGENPLVEKQDITAELKEKQQAREYLEACKECVCKMATDKMSVEEKAKHHLMLALMDQLPTPRDYKKDTEQIMRRQKRQLTLARVLPFLVGGAVGTCAYYALKYFGGM
jgi:DNA-directed RNA polymerase specialized sigma54-like protein